MHLSIKSRSKMKRLLLLILVMIVLLVFTRIYLAEPLIVWLIKVCMVIEVAGALVLLADLFNRRHFALGRYKAVASEEVYGGQIKNV